MKELKQLGHDPICVVRNPDKASEVLGTDARTVVAELTDRSALKRAFEGVTSVFVVTGHNPNMVEQQNNVLDAASGPGGFLKAVLEEIPAANGVWFDFSETMQGTARENLAAFNGRVSYTTGDLSDLTEAGPAEGFDLVTTSRATHHLLITDLGKFYASAASRLRKGGWIANIDSFNSGPEWKARLSTLNRTLSGRERDDSGPSSHPHINEPASLKDHMACLRAAGFGQPEIPWKSFAGGLLVTQKR